jgi:hypothetical protein
LEIQSVEETLEPKSSFYRYKNLNNHISKMISVKEIDDSIRKKCIGLSFDLQFMDSADRLAFMYEDPSFPRHEKVLMLETCISVMEQIEEYETCATLHRMRKYIISKT